MQRSSAATFDIRAPILSTTGTRLAGCDCTPSALLWKWQIFPRGRHRGACRFVPGLYKLEQSAVVGLAHSAVVNIRRPNMNGGFVFGYEYDHVRVGSHTSETGIVSYSGRTCESSWPWMMIQYIRFPCSTPP